MSDPTQPAERAHRNHGLFSDHYLNVTLPSRPEWETLVEQAHPVMEEVSAVFASFTPSANEAQTEQDLVRPILKLLGHDYEVQPALKTPDGTKRPDYVFYRDEASLNANKNKTLGDELLRGSAFAVGDAKYWDRPLDVSLKGRGDPFSNKNPGYQISFYLQHAGTEWGVLTNGRLWRLYHKDTAHKLDRFYEVDLHELATGGDVGRFLYFYAFFHRSAFDEHPLGVRAMLEESADYARSVGDSLKGQVYEALRHLAQGFLDYPQNELASDPETLREIYDNSLIVLYRLLFVLYAESRDLLPVRESSRYRDTYSLYKIKHDVADDLDVDRALLPDSDILWPRLRRLFRIINEGSPPLDVATFNGGLFDPARHTFTERHTVGDGHLQEAVDKLARVDGQFVDYRDLAERHLGTIYEGLLEFQLEPLPEPEEGWTVVLLNDKGERKATGSYYTPDHVVKYIVEETVGPVLRHVVEDAQSDEEKIEAVLGLNVLDPSMGSGHFLVEATEHIARFLVELDVSPEETDGEAELAYWKRRVAQSCVYGVDLNPLAVDLAKLSLWLATVARDRPLSFLDHHLRTGNSLVGARISDLHPADNRKRRKKAKQEDAAQLSMIGDPAFQNSMSTAVGSMWLIEESPADTVEEVKEQERIYETLREDLTRRYARLADLATATHFGLELDRTHWPALGDYTAGRIAYVPPQFERWLDESAGIAAERRFFHWELEFPEVFFDRQGRPRGEAAGFDAIVGNPPYISVTNIEKADRTYLLRAYEAATGRFDAYIAFLEKALRLTAKGGYFGYIVPIKFAIYANGLAMREMMLDETRIRRLVNVSQARVFQDPSTYPCVLVVEKREPDTGVSVAVSNVRQPGVAAFEAGVEEGSFYLPYERIRQTPEHVISPALDDAHWALLERAQSSSRPLENHYEVEQCIRIGSAQARAELVVDDLSRVPLGRRSLAHPVLDGEELGSYRVDWQGKYLLYEREKLYNPKSPAVLDVPKVLLKRVAPSLRCCPDDGTGAAGFYYPLNTVYALVPKNEEEDGEGVSLYFLAALLNSRLLDSIYKMLFEAIGIRGGYIEFREFVRHLPARTVRFVTPPEERERLRMEGQDLYARFRTQGDSGPLLSFVRGLLPRLPDGTPDTTNEFSDAVHDLLDGLGRQMVELNQRRRVVIEDLALDLEGVLSADELRKIGRLWTPPQAPKPSAKDYEKKLAQHLQLEAEAREQLGSLMTRRLELREDVGWIDEEQWKWLLKRRLKKVSSFSELVRLYRNHRPRIGALETEIAVTHHLIDRVVYALYGLDEVQIAVVDGASVPGDVEPECSLEEV